jgi:hypothetical protein
VTDQKSAESVEGGISRYRKFQWASTSVVPPVGTLDHVPKGGLRTVWENGNFISGQGLFFDDSKKKMPFDEANRCIFCNSSNGPFTDEHIIPEALGVDAFIQKATCTSCQRITSAVESQIIDNMFFHVRKHLGLKGKKRNDQKSSSKLDLGELTSNRQSVQLDFYPTMLMMPRFDPASSFSRRSTGSDSRVDWLVYNFNCTANSLSDIHDGSFAVSITDTVGFSQFVSKIALSFATAAGNETLYKSTAAKFISKKFGREELYNHQFDHMGCISPEVSTSEALHELEIGRIQWGGKELLAVKVRLFAKYGMPSYYVTFD